MTITHEAIEARIAALIRERDEYIQRAQAQINQQLAAYNGGISALQSLLQTEEPQPQET